MATKAGLTEPLKDERGVVSVEWIILASLVMVAIIGAFAPNFQAALNNGVTAVSNELTNQTNAAGS
jgi:Flp pilus assembly pilin Flp